MIAAAASVADAVKTNAAGLPFPTHVIESDAARYDAMKAATVALACSGTVTTELALAGCPMVVGYRLGNITYAIARRLIRTPYITLLNIAAGEPVAPEFIQARCNGPDLARAVALRLDDATFRAGQIAAQNAALARMGRGGPDPSERAAEVVVGLLRTSSA